jgi:agmatinase
VSLYLNETPYVFGGVKKGESPIRIIGIPLDISSSYRPGSRFAPLRIRESSINLEFYSIRTGVDFNEILFDDIGDLSMHPSSMEENLSRIEETYKQITSGNKLIVSLGGEHTITYGIIKAIKNEQPCVISFDAHLDLRNEYLGDKYSHACVMRRITEVLGEGKIIEVGTRAVTKEELNYAKENRILYITSRELRWLGIKETARKITKRLEECKKFYISYDMDAFDPAFAPGVATPEPEGLEPWQVLDIMEQIIDKRLIGLDIVEVSPPYDSSMITSMLASRLIIEASAYYLKSKQP